MANIDAAPMAGTEASPSTIARAVQPDTPVILMSGYTDQVVGVEPPDFFLEKPFNATMLESAIRTALART